MIYIFGNGNISFENFIIHYVTPLKSVTDPEIIVCDFRGTDTLMMEFLKTEYKNVSVLHVGEHSRYTLDKFKTKVSQWKFVGGFTSDQERDNAAIQMCTHFIAKDFNSDAKRESGTKKNIDTCLQLGKIQIK